MSEVSNACDFPTHECINAKYIYEQGRKAALAERRERIATAAMAALIQAYTGYLDDVQMRAVIADEALHYADALIAALDQSGGEK